MVLETEAGSFVSSTHGYIFFFKRDKGKVYVKKVYEIPQATRTSKGRAMVNFIGIEPGEMVAAIALVPKKKVKRIRSYADEEGADQEDRSRRIQELP